MSEGSPVALADRVTKRFGKADPALSEVSMRVDPGTITGLVGPDGAGKTTLIHLLAGLMTPDGGRVELLGGPPDAVRSELGYMPQRFGLYEDLSVLENLNLYAELRGLPPRERSATFERLLGFTDLGRFQDRLAGKLSG
ncbi:MAG TPA: ABC transporter ATP-binding protein, partial [Sphingomicrobium sp.]|nr:ABC transporter ATP-binding protein [Sphingomicrobium sp.]